MVGPDSLSLRQVTKNDKRFLSDLYSVSRDFELANVSWSNQQIKIFLKQQFDLQQKHYEKYFPDADRRLILKNNCPIGRLYSDFDSKKKQLCLIDITLQREYRGQGIGRYFIEQLIQKAKMKNAVISLHVHPQNPALRLYRSLGFLHISNYQGYYYMECRPSITLSSY